MKEFKDLKIAVAGTGYVGLSLAVLPDNIIGDYHCVLFHQIFAKN